MDNKEYTVTGCVLPGIGKRKLKFATVLSIIHSMKRILLLFSLLTIIADSYCQDEMKIWNEFLTLVKNNK